MNEMFDIIGASVPGAEHTQPGKPGWVNNHDAFAFRTSGDCLVAVVADGCGSEKYSGVGTKNSEVGAKIGVGLATRFLLEAGDRYAALTRQKPDMTREFPYWNRVATQITSHIGVVSTAMGGSLTETINDFFLFTLVGFLITPRDTFVFSCGDGVVGWNGAVMSLGPFPNNAPPYIAYRLTGSSAHAMDSLELSVQHSLPTDEVNQLLIGTDGVVDLSEIVGRSIPGRPNDVIEPIEAFWGEQYFANPDALRRRLAMITRERIEMVPDGSPRIAQGLLRDDTTLVVLRRKPIKSQEGR